MAASGTSSLVIRRGVVLVCGRRVTEAFHLSMEAKAEQGADIDRIRHRV